jgi:type IV pilus assembly protein PilM
MAKGNLIGLDIGSSSVKVCQLKESRRSYQLQCFGIIPLPPEAIVDGSIMNQTAVVDAVRELIASQKIKVKDVAVSVSGHSVILRKINLPVMTREELDESIQWEAEQYIPFDINDVNIDVSILNDHNDQGQMDVLLVAAKKDMINDYINVVREAGLLAHVVDVDSFAVQNAFEINYNLPVGETVALINVGASVVNINVVHSGISAFTRDIAQGGNQYTDEIQKQLNVSYDEAEALKIGGGGNDQDSVVPQEVERVMQQVSETIANDVQRSLDFYAATSADASINRIYLSGGCAKVPALSRAVEAKTGVPVESVDPFRNIDIAARGLDPNFLRAQAPVAAVSVGLALRSGDER